MDFKKFISGDSFAEQKKYEQIAKQEAKKERAIQAGIESYKMYSGQTTGKQVKNFEKLLRTPKTQQKDTGVLSKVNQGFTSLDNMFGAQTSKKYSTYQKLKQAPKATPSFFSSPFYEKPKPKTKRKTTRTVYVQVIKTPKRKKSKGPTRKYMPGFGYV